MHACMCIYTHTFTCICVCIRLSMFSPESFVCVPQHFHIYTRGRPIISAHWKRKTSYSTHSFRQNREGSHSRLSQMLWEGIHLCSFHCSWMDSGQTWCLAHSLTHWEPQEENVNVSIRKTRISPTRYVRKKSLGAGLLELWSRRSLRSKFGLLSTQPKTASGKSRRKSVRRSKRRGR